MLEYEEHLWLRAFSIYVGKCQREKLICHLYSCVKNNKLKRHELFIKPADVPLRAVTRSLLLYFYPPARASGKSHSHRLLGAYLKNSAQGLDLWHREPPELNFPSSNRARCVRGKTSPASFGMRRQPAEHTRTGWESAAVSTSQPARVGFYPSPLSDACMRVCGAGRVGDPSVYQNVRERFSRPAARRIFSLCPKEREVMQSERFIRVLVLSKFSLTVSYVGWWVTGRLWVLWRWRRARRIFWDWDEHRRNRFFSAAGMLLTECEPRFYS